MACLFRNLAILAHYRQSERPVVSYAKTRLVRFFLAKTPKSFVYLQFFAGSFWRHENEASYFFFIQIWEQINNFVKNSLASYSRNSQHTSCSFLNKSRLLWSRRICACAYGKILNKTMNSSWPSTLNILHRIGYSPLQ